MPDDEPDEDEPDEAEDPDEPEGRDEAPAPAPAPVDSPFTTFCRSRSAWSTPACVVFTVVWSWVVSRVASTWPGPTADPAATSTVATVPATGKATAAWATGLMVPTPARPRSTSWVETVAVR